MTMPAVRFLPEAVEDLLETPRWYGPPGSPRWQQRT
jgi:hypothetical protein